MRINTICVAALLLLNCWRGAAGQCGEGQKLTNSVCTNCSKCQSGYRVVAQCTNMTDTKCARMCEAEYEIQDIDKQCIINCSYCIHGNCDKRQQECVCFYGYYGITCTDLFPTGPYQSPTIFHLSDDSKSKLPTIVGVVLAMIAGVITVCTSIICYMKCRCSSRRNQRTENGTLQLSLTAMESQTSSQSATL